MQARLMQAFTVFVAMATLLGIGSSAIWFVSELADSRPPFGRYSLTIEPDSKVTPGGEYRATWNIERLRNDCRIGYTTVLFDASGLEHTLDSKPMGPPAKGDTHPGEIRSYTRKYTMPDDAAIGTAGMTSRIQWVCNDTRLRLGMIDFGNYNTANIEVVPK